LAKDILIIKLNCDRAGSPALFQELTMLGITDVDAEQMFSSVFAEIGDMALKKYKGAVPVRTHQLQSLLSMRSPDKKTKVIAVLDGSHTASNTEEPIPTVMLADILEEGKHRMGPQVTTCATHKRRKVQGRSYRRSKSNTEPFAAEGLPTADWAAKACEATVQEIQ
jgi:hypothetical protein